jgi:hypothetical protein
MQAFTGRLHRLIGVARYEARKLGATGVSMEAALADLAGSEPALVATAGPSLSSAVTCSATGGGNEKVYENSQEEFMD